MVIGYHLISTAYGWWLPNDLRGSTSHYIASDVIAELGALHFGRKRVQPAGHQIRAFYKRAEQVLKHELLEFDEGARVVIAQAFEQCTKKHGYTCYACAILRDHAHWLIRKHKHLAERMIDNFHLESTEALRASGLRPSDHPCWAQGGWKVFLDLSDDVHRTSATSTATSPSTTSPRSTSRSSPSTTTGPSATSFAHNRHCPPFASADTVPAMTVPPSPGFPSDPSRQPLSYEPAQHDPGRLDSPIARLVCWTVITLCVAFLIVSQYLPQLRGKKSASGPGGQSTAMQQFQMEFAARYAVGTHALFHKMQGAGTDPSAQLVDALRAEATTAADRFEVAIVVGEIQGPAEALKELEKVRSSPPAGPATAVTTAPSIEPIPGTLPTTVPSGVAGKPDEEDLRILSTLYSTALASQATTQNTSSTTAPTTVPYTPLAAADADRLTARYGWFGELAASFGRPDDDPVRADVVGRSLRTLFGLVGFFILMGLLLVTGIVLLIVALVKYTQGTMRLAGPARSVPGQPFLEVFAIYLPLFLALSFAMGAIGLHSMAWYLATTPILLAVPWLWPRMRGLTRDELKLGLGWTTGRGVLREIGCGFLGYIAGFPVVAIGFLVTFVLLKISGSKPSHPIVAEVSKVHPLLIYAVAALWAPLIEETMFRGALLHHLRARWNWLASASLVSLIFAMIHPQGWTLIPTLGAIAMVLAALREWRGSLIASMVAHGLTNFVTTTLLILTMR